MRIFFVVLLMMSIPVLSFAESKLIIKDNIVTVKPVTPDTMLSSVSINSNSSDFQTAVDQIESAAVIVKQHSDICEFNGYRVNPSYSYKDSQRELTGYTAYLHSPCSFTDIDLYNSFLNDINSLNSRNKSYEISMSNISWALKSDTRKVIVTALKLKLVKLATLKASEFSVASNKDCSVVLLNYARINYPSPRFESGNVRSAKFSVSKPDQSDMNISVSANYKLSCE